MNLNTFFSKQIIVIEIWISKNIFFQTNNCHRNMDFQKSDCLIKKKKKKKSPLRKVKSSSKKYDC